MTRRVVSSLSLLALVLALGFPIGAHATPLRIDFAGEIDTVFDPEELIAPGFDLGTGFNGFLEQLAIKA